MALTTLGGQNILKSLFGYGVVSSAQVSAPIVQSGCTTTASSTTVTLASAATWTINATVMVNIGGTYYFGLANAAGAASTSLVVDSWFTWGSTTAATMAASSSAVVSINAAAPPAFYLGIASTALTNYGATTESAFTELTTNGLGRAKATVAVTTTPSTPTGASNSGSVMTLTNTWTYTGSTSVTVNDLGVFIAPYVASRANNTLAFCTQITSAPTVSNNGDQLVVTETITQS